MTLRDQERNTIRTSEQGFTIMEVLGAMLILVIASVASLSLTVSSMTLEAVNREMADATALAHEMIAEITAMPFEEVFARLNRDPSDDPDGPGTAPGGQLLVNTDKVRDFFGVVGLGGLLDNVSDDQLQEIANSLPPGLLEYLPDDFFNHQDDDDGGDDSDGSVRPATRRRNIRRRPINVEVLFPLTVDGRLSEMISHPQWGNAQWDMDGDGKVSNTDVGDSYRLLPVRLRLTWNGSDGPAELVVPRIFTEK